MVETDTGESKIDNVRTSQGMFLGRGQDDIISSIEQRIAKWCASGLPGCAAAWLSS